MKRLTIQWRTLAAAAPSSSLVTLTAREKMTGKYTRSLPYRLACGLPWALVLALFVVPPLLGLIVNFVKVELGIRPASDPGIGMMSPDVYTFWVAFIVTFTVILWLFGTGARWKKFDTSEKEAVNQ